MTLASRADNNNTISAEINLLMNKKTQVDKDLEEQKAKLQRARTQLLKYVMLFRCDNAQSCLLTAWTPVQNWEGIQKEERDS